MNPPNEFPTLIPEPSPATASADLSPKAQMRAPYIAPRLEAHDTWVLTTGVSFPHESFLSGLPGRSS